MISVDINAAQATQGVPQGTQPPRSWYALRAFRCQVYKIKEDFDSKGYETFMALRQTKETKNGHEIHKDEQIIPQLLFVNCDIPALEAYKTTHDKDFMVYRHKVQDKGGFPVLRPAPIPTEQMQAFIYYVTLEGGKDIEYYGDTMPLFEEGERVRVTDGIYKGATGFVKRIKKDRKLLVAIEGVAVVAISHIPMTYLQKV